MDLCQEGHDEVCYAGRKCPVCDVLSDLADKNRELVGLEDKLAEANAEVKRLQDTKTWLTDCSCAATISKE